MTASSFKDQLLKESKQNSWRRYSQCAALSRIILITFLLSVCSLFLLAWFVNKPEGEVRAIPSERYDFSSTEEADDDVDIPSDTVIDINPSPSFESNITSRLRHDPKILLFVETQYSPVGRDIVVVLEATRRRFRREVGLAKMPALTADDRGKFSLVIFENIERYFRMDNWNRSLLDRYCVEYHVGIIGFPPIVEHSLIAATIANLQLQIHTNLQLQNYRINSSSSVLHMTKAEEVLHGPLTGDDWTVFVPLHSTYEPVSWAELRSPRKFSSSVSSSKPEEELITAVLDTGALDGVRKVFFGQSLKFWLHKLLFLDTISFLLNEQRANSLTRYILIDVDDIFVGKKGTRMTDTDVLVMMDTMERWRKKIPGFKFNLGFSGKFLHGGPTGATDEETKGDDLLLANVSKFWWFCHTWGHSQAHLYNNSDSILREMQMNLLFAKEHNIPTNSGYVVSPHHSGVYPVHEPLYDAWKRVWKAQVTSTEQYPHFKPTHLHRGFIHRGIKILPRQTCGLYTHTMYLDSYPGGQQKLLSSIKGGDLFTTLLFNPVNVYMTHLSNYAADRLGLYTFEKLFDFVRQWTNLRLRSLPPSKMADVYFSMFPEDSEPVWSNPCEDNRHLKIWAGSKSCERLPKLLVIGPQKTGTTALFTFLNSHPAIKSNYKNPATFEEVQFFNGNNYYKGLDWYMNFFPVPENDNNGSAELFFEKSATYFDHEMVPQRAFALLPHASIVAILIDPVRRAYSWYQHMKADGDPLANSYSFLEVVTASQDSPRLLRHLKSRCLRPGEYAGHLERWLDYYPSTQLLIIDGDILRSDPITIMHHLQRFVKIKPFVDYRDLVRLDKKKGFYCQIMSNDSSKCLGRGKGRRYAPMDSQAEAILQRHYQPHNVALHKLLVRLNQPVPLPTWLKADLS
ncbi:hypothetical protein RvY_11308 [Ramazzottius varieornatus]|uniref:[heparan sulfate]-glucosamine N-sulfotransferase n=1 Tax=Ramazzottius varieornatus TaxID=947166 RepID=A0A1D1VFQ4_RAMVA|nr:hypothetical protein RvY_11308 [Ramazzottius varieornatus]